MHNKKCLIVGGLGFIGKNLYIKLKKANTVAHLFSNTHLQKNDPFAAYFNPEDFILGDITNKESLNQIIADYNVIYCLAGISGASESINNPESDIQTNLVGHINILESCKQHNTKAHLIFPSTRLVYGKPLNIPVNEKHRLNPDSIYAIHKITAEYYYQLYHNIYGLNTTIYRISNPYGPFQLFGNKKYGILNWFIYKAFNQEIIEIFGTGNQNRDYLYIDDLSELLVKSINEEKLFGRIFNIGYGKGITILDMVKNITSLVPDAKYTLKEWPRIYKLIETGDYISDIKLINNTLGWRPKITFKEGIKQTVNFYRKYHDKK